MTASAAHDQRRYPRWLITTLLAGLNTLGPFSIDTYFPAFDAIGRDLQAGPIQMQQTLSIYLLGFALMLLFHGALSDAFGRRLVILISLVVFTAASVGCAFAPSIETLIVFRFVQGLCAGAGMVVGRAIIRDLYDLVEAQRMMAHVTMIFGLAPAIAPIIGGWLYVAFGWQAIFAFMALVSLGLLLASLRYLPESLPRDARHAFRLVPLARGYRAVLLSGRFVLLSLAVGLNFTAFFLYIASAPTFVQGMLGLGPTQFAWLFVPGISGIMIGAFLSGRSAGRLRPDRAVALGYSVMAVAALANLLYNHFAAGLSLPWAVLPLMGYTIGMSLAMPAISLIVLDLFPRLRGMAASLQGFISTFLNSVVSGVLAPVLAVSAKALAMGMVGLLGSGALCWFAYRRMDHG
jgi:DHA1 family bicyclomycin/chloramphenicol resistance-like MFS transporter